MNRRGFLSLLGGFSLAAATNPVHFLAPARGWRTTPAGLFAPDVELTVGSGRIDWRLFEVLTEGRVLLASGEELLVRRGDTPVVLPSCWRHGGGYAKVSVHDADSLQDFPSLTARWKE